MDLVKLTAGSQPFNKGTKRCASSSVSTAGASVYVQKKNSTLRETGLCLIYTHTRTHTHIRIIFYTNYM